MPKENTKPVESCPKCGNPIVPELAGCSSMVLYFPTPADRDEFIAVIRQAKPSLQAHPLQTINAIREIRG